MTADNTAVVDASAFVRFHTGDKKAEAWMRGAWLADMTLLAPELIIAEVANALLAYRRRSLIADSDFHRSLRDLDATVELVPLRDLFPEAANVALARSLTAYDACYVVLAEQTGAPLVTADRRLAAVTERGVLLA